jgi:hypothetical protein
MRGLVFGKESPSAPIEARNLTCCRFLLLHKCHLRCAWAGVRLPERGPAPNLELWKRSDNCLRWWRGFLVCIPQVGQAGAKSESAAGGQGVWKRRDPRCDRLGEGLEKKILLQIGQLQF